MPPRDTADLERRLRNVTEKLLGSFEELDFVYSMADVLGRPEGVGDMDTYLLQETLTLFRADGGWVARRGSDGGLQTTATQGLPRKMVEVLNTHVTVPLADSGGFLFWWTIFRALLSGNPSWPAVRLRPPLPPTRRGFLERFSVPLEVNTEVLGVICLAKQEPGDVFTAGDLRLLNTLAVQAALYIKNADLVERLRAEARSLDRRVQELESDPRNRPSLEMIDGPSSAMRRVAAQVKAASAADATVLLLGESGTGKSLVARILHRLSTRQKGAFVEVNCGAVPPGLIESELFGHTRGAFTGADRARAGLFEEADRGTILLDEVAELPPEAQVKLLTVLEQHRVRRVGENRDRSVNVRVVAATNADLQACVKDGKFREDLYYRLNVISLTIPPLRQREEDILHLARLYLRIWLGRPIAGSPGSLPRPSRVFSAYPWPGNVRELRNVVERALLMKMSGDRIEEEDLPLVGHGTVTQGDIEVSERPLPEAVQEYEKQIILRALRGAQGVVSRAASTLGISRTNLHNKLRKHNLLRSHSWDDTSQDS